MNEICMRPSGPSDDGFGLERRDDCWNVWDDIRGPEEAGPDLWKLPSARKPARTQQKPGREEEAAPQTGGGGRKMGVGGGAGGVACHKHPQLPFSGLCRRKQRKCLESECRGHPHPPPPPPSSSTSDLQRESKDHRKRRLAGADSISPVNLQVK